MIELVADQFVNLNRRQLGDGTWTEDTVSVALDGMTIFVESLVMLPIKTSDITVNVTVGDGK